MQNLSPILLTSAQAASGLGNVTDIPGGPYQGGGTAGQVSLKQEDAFVIHPNFTAGIGSIFQIEALSVAGSWCRVAGPFTTTFIGPQPAIQLYPLFGKAIRFNLTSLAGGGTVTVDGFMGASER